MKKITLIVLIGAMILGISSCKKESLPTMTANMNGTETNFIFRSTTMGNIPGIGDGFLILGTTLNATDGEYLALLIRDTEERAYSLSATLSGGKYECEALYRKDGKEDTTNVYIGQSGTITITKLDEKNKKISGTFSLKMVNKLINDDTFDITEGQFSNLSYVKLDADIITDDFDL